MTIVFTSVAPDMVVMTVDSTETRIINNERFEYDTTAKLYTYEGVGCVARWGSLDHNNIRRYLDRLDIRPETFDVDELARAVTEFLTEEYRPHDLDLDDLGYHVAGFSKSGKPVVYHIYYGYDRPRNLAQKVREYKVERYFNQAMFLYNGRNDLAEEVVNLFLAQVQRGEKTRFDITNKEDRILFGDFVARFSAEITPEVGPPFFSCVVSPSNQVTRVRNDNFAPLDREELKALLVT